MLGSLMLAGLAGLISTLSPCVLPILPAVLGAAATEHRMGPLALAGGLAMSFVTVGLFVSTIGFSIGLDADVFRILAALLMMLLGVVLIVPRLQEEAAVAVGPAGRWASDRLTAVTGQGLGGQFVVGLLLGAVWSPCVGPTLGAASVLAAQRQNLPEVALTMLIFGIGAAFPLLALGWLSREAMLKLRNRMLSAGGGLKAGLGVFLVAMGLLVVTGLDKQAEARFVQISPQWLMRLTTQF